jgi:plasmid stabilization system protein ParE
VTVFFGRGVFDQFKLLPEAVQLDAIGTMSLIAEFPHMCPVRQRGVLRGHRYFTAGRFFFYYKANSQQVRIAAIVPAGMRLA